MAMLSSCLISTSLRSQTAVQLMKVASSKQIIINKFKMQHDAQYITMRVHNSKCTRWWGEQHGCRTANIRQTLTCAITIIWGAENFIWSSCCSACTFLSSWGPQGPVCASRLSESDKAAEKQISPSNETSSTKSAQVHMSLFVMPHATGSSCAAKLQRLFTEFCFAPKPQFIQI